MDIFHMSDVISLIGLPYPPSGHSTYNIPCPCCDDKPGKKHLNINLKKDVFRCPRCGFSGGVFDLYAHYAGIPREEVREALIARLNVHTEIASNELEEEAISNEMAKQVQAAIAQLKPIQRERLIKYFFEGKTLLQIAAEEGKSYSTVYESYQTALKKLKKYLKIPDNLTSPSPNK